MEENDDLKEFNSILIEGLKQIGISIEEENIQKLFGFMTDLIEENKKVNLTAITNPKEVIYKHFVDSLSIEKFIKKDARVIDVGTGAGFPGIPLAMYRKDIEITLLDSLKKRVEFLNKEKEDRNIENVQTIWGRAETYAKEQKYRETFDVAVSRAVAPMNVLTEYLLPYAKVGGICICMKGPNIEDEIEQSKNAIEILGGKIEKIEQIKIENFIRTIVIIKKEKNTDISYPRKEGTPSKKPL